MRVNSHLWFDQFCIFLLYPLITDSINHSVLPVFLSWCTGHGIHEVMTTYNNLHPVLFSLMTGRTVLVVGPAKMEMEVTKIVTALSIFLPDSKRSVPIKIEVEQKEPVIYLCIC